VRDQWGGAALLIGHLEAEINRMGLYFHYRTFATASATKAAVTTGSDRYLDPLLSGACIR
jgi:hypothetical protein